MFAKISNSEAVNLLHVRSITGYEKETGMSLQMDNDDIKYVDADHIDDVKHKLNICNHAIVRIASGSF